ncbi:hypothetical protein XbC2_72 [Xanthomonas phage XbC2]|nr:hypothetical protein XbC2_72 [Xanthomonas phage XbC2]
MSDKIVFACVVLGFFDENNYSWSDMFINASPEEIHNSLKTKIDVFRNNPNYEICDITIHTKHHGFDEDEFIDDYYDIIMDGMYD